MYIYIYIYIYNVCVFLSLSLYIYIYTYAEDARQLLGRRRAPLRLEEPGVTHIQCVQLSCTFVYIYIYTYIGKGQMRSALMVSLQNSVFLFRQRDFLGTPVNLLLSSQKCQGVPFFTICKYL